MIIGVPRRLSPGESRRVVALAAYQLVKRGISLGGSGRVRGRIIPDEEYVTAGAEIVATHAEVFAQAEMIVKVKEPLAEEFPLLRAGRFFSPICISRRASRSPRRSLNRGTAHRL